jgi:hypothetical protein
VSWRRDDSSLSLLDERAGPFSNAEFRAAVVATVDGWRDVSFGAVLADGVRAALPVLARGGTADSVPPSGYGGVAASRPLTTAEEDAFLDLAFAELGERSLEVRTLDLAGTSTAGEPLASAAIVSTAAEPSAGYSRLTRRSLAKAARAGCSVETSASFDVFWPLYVEASESWAMRYPETLVRELISTGVARVHAVRLRGNPVAVLLTLARGAHWMCWLAGQSSAGRDVAASYLAYDAVLSEAHAAGAPAVNLGASVGGGAEFKQHLGAVPRPMRVWRRRRRRLLPRILR